MQESWIMTEMKSKVDRRNLIISYVLISILMIIPALCLHMSYTVDEMGTVSNAAYLAGYDWSLATLQAGNHYYKYGTVLFYALPYLLIQNSVLLYRVMLVINGLAIGTTGIACYLICRRHLHVDTANGALLMTLASTMIPAVLFQSAYCRGDFVLVFTPWLVLFFLLEAYRSKGRRKILYSVVCALTASYAFMSHTRGIVLVIALFLTILVARYLFRVSTVHIPAYLCTTFGCLAIDRFLTAYFKHAIWVNGTAHASLDGARFSDMVTMLSPAGLKVLIKSFFGWLYTIFSSTMGLVCVGILASVILLFLAIRKKHKIGDELVLTAILAVLNFGGSIAMGILFFYPYLYDSFAGKLKNRFDRVFFERYMVGTLGIISLIAIYVLVVRRDLFRIRSRLLSFGIYALTLIVFCKYIAVYLPYRKFHMKYVSSLNVFSGIFSDKVKCLVGAGVLGLLVCAVILLFYCSKRIKWWPLLLLCAVYFCIYCVNVSQLRLEEDDAKYPKLQMVYRQIDALDIDTDRFPYICFVCQPFQIKTRQPLFKEFQTISHKAYSEDITDLFIVTTQNKLNKNVFGDEPVYKLAASPDEEGTGYKLYVKGEKLKAYLTERGIALTECGGQK